MKGLRNLLLEEQFRLENIIKETKTRLEQAPEGRLRLSKSHNQVQYYCCTEENKSGNYIPKEKIYLAKRLAQKAYDEKVLQLAEKRYAQIRKLSKDYTDDELEKIYLKEHVERRNEDPFNSHLNYGYAIIRNTIIRELLSTGLQPALGIHHCNPYNAFNLADDLIEPWRPMVDLIAYYNVGSNTILTKQQRGILAHVVHNACRLNGEKLNILSGIEKMVE